MSITLNLKNDSIVQYVTPGKTYSEFSHRDNDKSSAIDIGVKTLEDNSKESFIGLNADKIYHNGNNITPNNFITNCITSIPEDIKLELNNGTLTLKAGSKVYVPNGFEANGTTRKFDVVTVTNDVSWAASASATNNLGFYNVDGTLSGCNIYFCYSGSTAKMNTLIGSTRCRFYNTETNRIYIGDRDSADANWVETNSSLPFCIFNNDSSGTVTSIDQVFNGFGYIGATAFVLPGVKGLIPDHRNPDGSLKSIEFTTNSVLTTLTYNMSRDNSVLTLNARSFGSYSPTAVYRLEYNEKENINYNTETGTVAYAIRVGFISCDGERITSLKPKPIFHAVDYSDFNEHRIIGFQRPNFENNFTWYRLYSDGWVEQGGIKKAIANNSNFLQPLPITMADGNYTVTIAQCASDNSGYEGFYRNHGAVLARTTTTVTLSNRRFNGTDTYTIDIMWEVKGMSAI